jgi:uncharacterized protein (TIGR00255 family)
MTGYGMASGESGKRKYTIEIKTLNSKQFDMLTRFPQIYKEKELEIRSLLQKMLERGKIEITIAVDEDEANDSYELNRELVKKYYHEIAALQQELNPGEITQILPAILKLPEVVQAVPEKLEQEEWEGVLKIIVQAINHCDTSRMKEGEILEKDFRQRIMTITSLLESVENFEGQRIEKIKIKLRHDLEKFFEEVKIDENRFEQEIIYYLEKIDITEEKVRLSNHCNYFLQTLSGASTSNGKKLNFIGQEIGREINTIGSKANDSNIQKLVVQMKDELEKIKEQLFNIL